MEDFIEVINQPIDVNIGTSFIVSVDVLPVEVVETFDLTFEIMGNGLFFKNPSEPLDLPYRIVKRFIYNPERFIQRCNINLTIVGSALHFPIRTILRVYSMNSSPSNCKINIYDAIA